VLAAFVILIILICASPTTLFVDGNIVSGFEAMTMAIATALVAARCTPADTQSLLKLCRPVFLFASIPAFWMIIQMLPLGYVGLANPIWESVQSILGQRIVGSIGIDTGSELLVLCQYLSVLAILFVTAAITLDRKKADGVLSSLLVATILLCLPIAGLPVWLRGPIVQLAGMHPVETVAAIGVLVAAAAIVRAFERWQSLRGASNSRLVLSLAMSVVGFAICGSAIFLHWTNNLAFGLALAMTVFSAVMVIRYFRIGFWGGSAIATTILTACIVFVWIQFGNGVFDPMLAFSDDGSLVDLTKLMLSDATWTGSGAGSFEVLSNVYMESGAALTGAKAATAVAKIAIELGRPMVWTITLMLLLTIAYLLRGALRRGRDAFYPALGASSLIAIVIFGFGSTGILAPAALIIAASTLGLALAQSSGRTIP